MFNRFNDPHPDPVDAWLSATFPLQHQLRAEMAADLRRRAPLPVDAPDKSFLGRVVELAIGLDVCDRAPYARLFNCLGHDYATRMLTMAGYAPGPDATAPGNVSWLRIGPAPHPSRLFSVASRLTHVQCLLRDLRDRRRDAEYAAGMILERHPGLLCRRPDEVFGTRPAFRELWASYTGGFDAAMRSYGPATAQLSLYRGSRHADFLLGTTLLEVKSGRLDRDEYLDSLIKQLLEYVLLAHSDGHPVSHLAAYAVRYQRLLRYPIQETLNWLAGTHIDLTRAGEQLRAVLDGQQRGWAA